MQPLSSTLKYTRTSSRMCVSIKVDMPLTLIHIILSSQGFCALYLVVACGWEEGAVECLLHRYQVSFWDEENVQLDSGDAAVANVLGAADF